MTIITTDGAVAELLEVVPELKQDYETELNLWKGEKPGAHIIFGNVLNPYLISQLQMGEEKTLNRIFDFLEHLATKGDNHVQEVIATTVCEGLGDNAATLEKARVYMGTQTTRLSQAIETFWTWKTD